MDYRQLGSTGVRVSALGLGTNLFGWEIAPADVPSVVDAALDAGINFFDSADRYTNGESEATLGQALKGRWDRVVLCTKFGAQIGDRPNDRGASRYHLMHAVEASLRRLGSDHIDVYYLHFWDDTTPIDETLRTLDDLVSAGKVRYIGVSNCSAWQAAYANGLAHAAGWAPFSVVQQHYNMLERGVEAEMLPFCRATGLGFVPYFPLAAGFLTGKYQPDKPAPADSRGVPGKRYAHFVERYMTAANYARIERLSGWAQDHGHGLAELALAWLLARPGVTSVIAGASSAAQVQRNLPAAEWRLSPDEVAELDALLAG